MFLLLYSIRLYNCTLQIKMNRRKKALEIFWSFENIWSRPETNTLCATRLFIKAMLDEKSCEIFLNYVMDMLDPQDISDKNRMKKLYKKHSLFSEDGITILCWISRALCTVFFDKFINFLAWLENFSDKRLAACTVRSTETSLSAAWNRVSKWSRGLCHPSFAKWGEIDSEVAFDSHRINLIPLSSALSSSSSKSGLSHSCKWYLTF